VSSGLRLVAGAAAVAVWCTVAALAARQAPPPGAAWLVRELDARGPARQSRSDILDTPVLPGSIVKTVALVAALDSGAITERSSHVCRRVVTVDGHSYACAHPALKRALTPAEALAYSCNDFFLSLAPRLSRESVNAVRGRAGLPPLPLSTPLAAALVGLDGPRVTPRALLDVLARLAGAGPSPVPMRAETRRVLLEGLRGAAEYGTASAIGERRVAALAKTGTAPMPGGGTMGLVVALVPPDAPTRGVVVVAPGAAGLDAAAVAADLLQTAAQSERRALGPIAQRALRPIAPPAVRVGRSRANGGAQVETLDLERYVSEVVAGEAHRDSTPAALEALAIAVRTYAVANRGRHAQEGFDLCDTTHCQVLRPASALTRRAAGATSGRVLLAGDRVAEVYHSAWCGGHPERPSDVWPGASDDGAAVGRDEACAGEPGWTSELRAPDLERAFKAAGLRGGPLRDVRVIGRDRTGRVTRVGVEGWSPSELSGQEFRTLVGRHVGWQHVKSTLFELTRTASGYRVSGRGFGHGAGLCVLGATRRAARGSTTEQILSFYFPGLTVGAAPAEAAGDVKLALPGEESSERGAVLALIQRSRDEIAHAAGVHAAGGLRVTVHPTVESFGRASGQPWFVAGATHGSTIDLLPLTVLRRAGQLERVVRHEVAHVLIDAHLEGRPMWVREGAAAYFAGPATGRAEARPLHAGTQNVESGLPAALRCPTDAELRRPASAAAQRDAYDRAHACFARQIASGTPWRDVR
jgi:SpoIID/LytB domain protein